MKGVSKKYQNSGWPIHIGYIIVPPLEGEDDRSKFIDTCYRKKKVSVLLRDGGVAHNCPIPKFLLREIEFPENFGEVGSSLLLYIEPFYNSPMIICLYEKENDADFSEEFEKRLQSINGENLAQISTRGSKGIIDLNVDSDQEDGGVIQINISNKNRSGKLKLNVLGDSEIYVSNKCALYSNSEVDLRVEDLETEEVSSINVKGSAITLNDNVLNSFMADINALVEKYNALESKVNDVSSKYNGHIHITTATVGATPTPGTIAPTTDQSTDILIETTVDDIKDEKIKN